MNPKALAGLLKNVYSSFDMDSFENRLKLQKMVYLLQAYGVNIGYNYSYYLYGPYSRELTRDGFEMPKLGNIKQLTFKKDARKEKLGSFTNFIEEYKDDPNWLETAATLHFYKVEEECDDSQAIKRVQNKRQGEIPLDKNQIKSVLEKMKEENLV